MGTGGKFHDRAGGDLRTPQRAYLFDKPVEPAIVNALRAEIRACNAEGGLHIQL